MKVALQKTEVVAFYRQKHKRAHWDTRFEINGIEIPIKS